MVGAQNIQAYLYIYHMGLKFNLPVLPETITDTMNVNFVQETALARSAPYTSFTGAGPRTVNVDINLHRQMFALENQSAENYLTKSTSKEGFVILPNPVNGQPLEVRAVDAADLLINALLTLSLPKYLDGPKALVPPSVLIRYGEETEIRGIPSNITKTSSGPWLKSGKQAQVKISFNVTEVEPMSAQFVAQYGSMRGLRSTLERSAVWQYDSERG